MKITMKRILSTITALVIFTSCVPTPDNVKNSEAEKDKTESANEFVAADDLYCDADMIKQYIKDKGYTKQLIFNGTTVIDKVDKLYELDIETLTDAHQKFSELYNTLFNSDFYRDSNVNNINKLPKYSENADAKYVFDDFTSIGDGVIYNNENPDKQTSQYLNVSTGGFVYYENYRYSQGKNYQSIYRVVDNNVEGKEYKMTDGSLYKLKDAVEYSNKFINKSFKPLGSEYVYRVGRIAPMIMQNDSGAYNYYLDIEKTYKGVPFCNQIIADYEKGERHFRPSIYITVLDGKNNTCEIDAPFGFDKVVNEKEITTGLVSWSEALDIMHKELAPNIKLNITEIRLMYMCDYDGADVDEAVELSKKNKDGMTRQQNMSLSFPDLVPSRKCTAYPVWAFIVDKNKTENSENYSNIENCDMIVVNAKTGKITSFIDRVSSR